VLIFAKNMQEMKSSQPYRQDFFMFDKNISMNLIVEAMLYIQSSYLNDSKVSVSLNTFEESYSDLSFTDILKFDDKKEILNTLSLHLSKDSERFSLIMQFNNDNVGANGNYTVMTSTKETNLIIEKCIKEKLALKKYVLNPLMESPDNIIVNPVFNGRNFSMKDKHCFILMPFTESWSDRVWKQLGLILEREGFSFSRADSLYGHNILEDIWIAINESSLIIADITSRNPNVFYEIGIAHTLGKKVILLTQKVTDIPFDFKNYRHIIYEDNVDGFNILSVELPNYLK
jgi:hypothetical protein